MKTKKNINSREKGKKGELELAHRLTDLGHPSHRGNQYKGTPDSPDVVGLPGLHVEAKHQERMQLYEWMSQAVRDAEAGGEGRLPAVFHKKNNADILVTMRLEDFMSIYREWEAGQDLKKG